MTKLIDLLRRWNDGLAVAAGLLLLVAVAVTIFDIVARRFAASLGGTEELSGYAMAIATSWGVSYALTCRAHVRIDLLRARATAHGRSLFDAGALVSLAATAVFIAYKTWPVLEKTLKTGATANTELETPLWIPQTLWWLGWVWFAISALTISIVILVHLVRRDYQGVDEIAGMGTGS